MTPPPRETAVETVAQIAVETAAARPIRAGGAELSPRTRVLLEAPIPPTLLRLAAPNVIIIAAQAAMNVLEAVFVGWLGRDALAGVALVFPLIMLMQTMSAGGMGGGVASAVARALGAGRRRDADALVLHAVLIALVFGAAFTIGMLVGGPPLYRAMGGTEGALAAALMYSNVVFVGAIAVWLFNTLGAVLRGAGNMLLPALVGVSGGPLLVALSPALIWGWGPFPRLEIAGAGVAFVTYYTLGSVVLAIALRSRHHLVRLSLRGVRLRAALFGEILRVGLPGALNTVQTNLTVVVLTGLVGGFGTVALAGYGIGARLEYLMIPLVFGLGSALVTMVGTNIGAGHRARALRIAFVGGAMAFALTEAIGLLAAFWPAAWMGLFTRDADVVAVGSAYLRVVGPSYGFFGLGLALYFASQGAGRLLWPLLAGFTRLSVAATAGWVVIHWLGGGLAALWVVIALAFVLFGVTLASAVRGGAWRR
jgi:putative MATE family efflux protein